MDELERATAEHRVKLLRGLLRCVDQPEALARLFIESETEDQLRRGLEAEPFRQEHYSMQHALILRLSDLTPAGRERIETELAELESRLGDTD